ncbi:unnamed protein product, partial [Tilletia controversa]
MSKTTDNGTGHNRQDLDDADLFLFCSQHWRDHHGYYRHSSDYTHEHVHIRKRDLFAPGTRGTVAVLQPLVGSLLDTGLAQQVATLVLAPLSSDAAAPATGLLKNGLNLVTDVNPSDNANAANAFLLSPSSTQPGTKLMLVDSPNQVMIKPITTCRTGDKSSSRRLSSTLPPPLILWPLLLPPRPVSPLDLARVFPLLPFLPPPREAAQIRVLSLPLQVNSALPSTLAHPRRCEWSFATRSSPVPR